MLAGRGSTYVMMIAQKKLRDMAISSSRIDLREKDKRQS